MDNFTLGGSKPTVINEINIITTVGPSYGLHLNISKCEALSDTSAADHPSFDGFEQKTTDLVVLLGAPLNIRSALTECLAARWADLARSSYQHTTPWFF